jgi:hypothetical protein
MKSTYKLILLGCLTFVAIVITFLMKPIPQDLSYHNFSDGRTFIGIPDFANVISNFPFVIVGTIGLLSLRKATAPKGVLIMYAILFSGIVLTGFGSAYYHLHPDNTSLVYDRIPMTIVFMALLSATIAELIDLALGLWLLAPLLLLGIISVIWWSYSESIGRGDLRLYGFVQFYPMLFIPLILVFFPASARNRGTLQLIWVVAWYIVAKLFEKNDSWIYSFTGFISGHSLKHIAAAGATWYLVKMFQENHSKKHMQTIKRQIAV